MVSAQRIDRDAITLGRFRMMRTGVVLFENRMMNDRGWHIVLGTHASGVLQGLKLEQLARRARVPRLPSVTVGLLTLVLVPHVRRRRVIKLLRAGCIQLTHTPVLIQHPGLV